eukprot:5661360-Amphidinium_carterae.1
MKQKPLPSRARCGPRRGCGCRNGRKTVMGKQRQPAKRLIEEQPATPIILLASMVQEAVSNFVTVSARAEQQASKQARRTLEEP